MSFTSTRNLRSRDNNKRLDEAGRAEEENDLATASHYLTRVGVKRKVGENVITVQNTPKKPRTIPSEDPNEETTEHQDVYCWECHKECVENCLDCSSCPRTFHPVCLPPGTKTDSDQWICPICLQMTRAECTDTRSWAMQLLSPEQLCTLLAFALRRMRHSDSEPFQNPVPASLVPDYYDIIFHPMDISTLEKNVKKLRYASTEAFLEDAKWILHNSIIFNGASSKYCTDAKLIIKICKHEMAEVELCPDCYRNSCLRQDNWFAEPCTFQTYPHCLVWAKLKGFPFWPAKALRMSSGNQNVDVRFFGAHDRAWIPIGQCFLLSEESPVPTKNMKKHGLDKAMEELDEHVNWLVEKFGQFTPAPFKTEFIPEHLYNCPVLFGECGEKEDGTGKNTQMRPRPPGSPTSSVTAGSEGGSLDMEPWNDSRTARARSEEPAPPLDKTGETVVNGVFTMDEALDKELRKGSEALEEEVEGLQVEDNEQESLSCLEKFRHSLQADLSASTDLLEDGLKDADDSSASVDSTPGSAADTPPPPKVQESRKRNLNQLVDRMHEKKETSAPPPAKKSSVTITVEKMRPIGMRLTKPPSELASNHSFQSSKDRILSYLGSSLERMWSDAVREAEKPAPEASSEPTAVSGGKEDLQKEQTEQRLRSLHEAAMATIKDQCNLSLTEMRQRLDAGRAQALEDLRRSSEEEKAKAINETKSKQWCAQCRKEAVFYCCWNTSYCDYPCQQQHWPKHQNSCAQIRHNQPPSAGDAAKNNNNNSSNGQVVYQGQMVPLYAGPGMTGLTSQSYIAMGKPPSSGSSIALIQHRPPVTSGLTNRR